MAGMPGLSYDIQLSRLIEAAGDPKSTTLSAEIERKYGLTVHPNTIDGWRLGRTVPRDTDKLHAFLGALTDLARERGGERSARFPVRRDWDRLVAEARKGRTDRGDRAGDRAVSARSASGPHWLDDVTHARVWQLVDPGTASGRAEAVREQTCRVVLRLAGLYDEKQDLLRQDPWHDPDLARRTVRWANRLLDAHEPRTLAPVEAALLALLPFLYQVQNAATVDALRHVDPTDLDELRRGGRERDAYNRLLRNHKRLVRQAMRGDALPDRSPGRPEIGWWLFRQWVKPQFGQLASVLAELGPEEAELGAVLEQPLLSRLLGSAHMTPRQLYGRRPEGLLEDIPFFVDFHGRDPQTVRERLVGPLFAITHAMAIEVTDLPMAVVTHVGIPDPLVPQRLLRTLNKASWIPVGDTLALHADCDHPASVAALSEHAQRLDVLLREARRSRPVEELGSLPVYAHADGVREVDDTGEPRQGGEVIRFRLDEERIQELLMGENLYRDRSLAIRELYQNALDACRYRRAWQCKRDGRDTFEGEIVFRQGYDEYEQRHYLECEDNGIGMDETVLAEVFSRAGVRFVDHSRFQEESRHWEGEGITVHPNSRFGIGVLSYFMLADEIRVTTCPLDVGEGRPEKLTVLITGPGHYFRVRRTGERGRVGTTVRLYLRDGGKAPSCVRELRRLLGVAEFRTTANKDEAKEVAGWRRGALEPREASLGRQDGFVASGRTVAWPEDDRCADGQVFWCEHGGGILADGIFIEPRVRAGILAGPESPARLRGAVVNLTGGSRPRDLSVDRTEILDPAVHEQVEKLVRDAIPALLAAEPPLLTAGWLADVARHSPRLADLVTEAAGEAGVVLETRGHPSPVATAGFFARDATLVHLAAELPYGVAQVTKQVPDDATKLWRLLAHCPNAELTALTALVPELALVEHVLPARPSDALMLTRDDGGRSSDRPWIRAGNRYPDVRPGHVLATAMACGVSYDEARTRMQLLRLSTPGPSTGPVTGDAALVALLDASFGNGQWMALTRPVPPGHLLGAHLTLNIAIDEAIERLVEIGFTVPDELPAHTPAEWVVRLLSHRLNGRPNWLDPAEPVVAGHVLWAMRTLERSFSEVVAALTDYGFRPELGTMDDQSASQLLRHITEWGWAEGLVRGLDVREDLPPGLVVHASKCLGITLREAVQRMAALGFSSGVLPEEAVDTDAALLGLDEGSPDVFDAGSEIPLAWLVQLAEDSGLAPREAAARLRAYGFAPQDSCLPERLHPGDADLLRTVYNMLPEHDDDLATRTVPMFVILHTAEEELLSPQSVIDCLRRYGVRTWQATGPTKASKYDTELVTVARTGTLLDWNVPVPLYHLVEAPIELLMEPEDAVRRMAELGLDVPVRELESLDETDRSLCRDRFGEHNIQLPLPLPHPIEDFITIAALAPLPMAELLPRLTRLGVDLPRVAEAVRAALPQVPGLVMTPTEP
ncbi:wHTH domain-containing protein [Streptomyces sp. NPDC054770]